MSIHGHAAHDGIGDAGFLEIVGKPAQALVLTATSSKEHGNFLEAFPEIEGAAACVRSHNSRGRSPHSYFLFVMLAAIYCKRQVGSGDTGL
jgi:hypothetical protein